MSIRLLRILLGIAIALVALGLLLGLGFLGHALISGEPLATTLPLLTDRPEEKTVVLRGTAQAAGRILYDHATLSVSAGGIGYTLLQGLDILVTCGLWLLALLSLRRLITRIGASLAFQAANVRLLRVVGWSLIALNIWTVIRGAFQPVLLAHIAVGDATAQLLPSIARGTSGMENLRIDLALDPVLLICGLIVLVLAEAFRAGQALREENESFL